MGTLKSEIHSDKHECDVAITRILVRSGTFWQREDPRGTVVHFPL